MIINVDAAQNVDDVTASVFGELDGLNGQG